MKILQTGGTGYIGSRVLTRLLDAGHEVTALVRSEDSAARLRGGTPLIGDLSDDLWLTGQLKEYDGVIHTAAGSDGHDDELDAAVIEAAERSFSGSDKHVILTGGIWTYGSSPAIRETDEPNPPAITAWRIPGENAVLAADYHGNVIEPGVVYGYGAGIPSLAAAVAREGASIGDGAQHWTTVHVDDLADLYLLVLEQAPPHEAYAAASGECPTALELARSVNPDAVPGTREAAAERIGPALAEAFLLDQQADGAKAKALGWSPRPPSLVELLRAGYPGDR